MVNKMASTGNDFAQRTRHLEERIIDPRSSISVDSLLDSIVALIYDSEGLKKTKNFDSFYTKCKHASAFAAGIPCARIACRHSSSWMHARDP